jgi:alkanesulfonate monooxygenase SsuD/methylene tetrahydromethanopterin reductase-like flavin-dependent oxidoreductase (luciferase family)
MGKTELPVGVHSHGFVGETDAQAREDLFADYKRMRDKIGAERGWPPMTRADFEGEIEHGSLYVGSPETVARKIAATVKTLEVSRFDLKYSAGPLSHEKIMRSIELYGRKVIPLVRAALA